MARYEKYDRRRFDEILNLFSTKDNARALYYLSEYIKEYPNDVMATAYYVKKLLKSGMFDEVPYLLEVVERYLDEISDSNKFKDFHASKLKYYMYTEQFELAYAFLLEHEYRFKKLGNTYDGVQLFLRKKLGLIDNVDELQEFYNGTQILEYSEEDAISHIKQRHAYYTREKDVSIFNPEFKIDEMYHKARKMLPSDTGKQYDTFFMNANIFKYRNCGIYGGRQADFFKVITLLNSDEIITMYPTCDEKGSSIIVDDYNYDESNPKIKRLSAIEKFQKRYGNK